MWNSLTQTAKADSCPGECIHAITSIFCDRVLEDQSACGQDQLRCCVSHELFKNLTLLAEAEVNHTTTTTALSITPPASKSTTTTSWMTTTTTTARPTSTTTTTTTTMAPTTQLPLEECNGTCYAPLFMLLCEDRDDSKYCSNGGACCMEREPATPAPRTCKGSCIPVFFSGAFCNRPAELIPKTVDCMAGTICCAESEKGDVDISEEADEHNDANVDGEEIALLNHPPPQINRPVPKPLQPPPHMMFSQQRPFPSFPIHSYPQAGSYSQVRQNRPMEVVYGPVPMGREPVRKPSFSIPPKPIMPQPQLQTFPSQPQHNGMIMNGNEQIRGQSAPGPVVVDPPPMCTGVCITPLLKFTCFGSNVLYQNFACQSPEEICCAPVSEVQAYEASLLKNVISAHFLDVKPVLHPSVIPNFIATKGQALGPHLQHHGQQTPVQQSPPPHQPMPIPRPQQPMHQPSMHPMPKPQMPVVMHAVSPVSGNNKHIAQSIPQQGVLPITLPAGSQQMHLQPVRTAIPQPPSAPTAGNTMIESIHSNAVTTQKVGPAVSSPSSSATPAVVIRQTQNLPPTESTMSLNSSSLTSVTVFPQTPAVSASASASGSYSNTTLASITNIITSITTSTSTTPPLSASSVDPEETGSSNLHPPLLHQLNGLLFLPLFLSPY